MPARLFRPAMVAGAALALAGPASALDMPPAEAMPAPAAAVQGLPGHDIAAYERARADWLAECRRRHGSGKAVGGAVAGGLVGGLLGNRIAGRGNRTEGTVAGAVVGAVAGGAIGHAADSREAADYCQSYLDQYASYNPGGHGHPGYGYALQPMMVMVPVAMVPQTAPAKPCECVEEVVTEEYDAPPARRVIPPPRRLPPKRVPDKRVRSN